MSQNDFNIANQGFPATRADINSALQALASNSAGTAEPSTTYAYQFWYDETNELLKMRNSDNDAWITIGTFDQVADTFTPAGVTTDKIEEGNSSVEVVDTGTGYVAITVDGVEAARVDANGRLGIGTTSPDELLHLSASSGATIRLESTTTGASAGDIFGAIEFETQDTNSAGIKAKIDAYSEGVVGNAALRFFTGDTTSLDEACRIDSSGNLLVGTTDTGVDGSSTEEGLVYVTGKTFKVSTSGQAVQVLNRLSTGGDIAVFRYNGATVGSIGTDTNDLYVASANTHSAGLLFNGAGALGNQDIRPCDSSGAGLDNVIDLGDVAYRFDDIYATNGTIQTSDINEKQDIETLSDAEQRVAVAAKGLLRKYRWKDAVAEKGDAARIHFGIIAQDLQAAFEAEGLDAGRYGMFISSTWWEADRVIPAVAAQDAVYETVVIPAEYDEDGNEISPETTEQRLVSEAVEAQPERTVTDTFDTQEEAPEGAVERTRMGVRYPELLAFIIAAI